MLIVLQRGADAWTSYSVIRMKVIGEKVDQIVDYIHCPWMMPAATSISLVCRSRDTLINPDALHPSRQALMRERL